MASFMMGQFTQNCGYNDCGSKYEIQARPATTNYQYGFFVQDNWKATRKLTVNLGLGMTLPCRARTASTGRTGLMRMSRARLNSGSLTYDRPG